MGGASAPFLMTYNNWREDPGLISTIEYKRKFALFPQQCSDGPRIWLKYYYARYKHWGTRERYGPGDDFGYHTDFLENISEAEYIIRKLAENL